MRERARASYVSAEQYYIYRESTAQVKGTTKMMVAVEATQALKAGDVLRRFEADTARDEPHRGSIIYTIVVDVCNAYIYCFVCVDDCVPTHVIFSLCCVSATTSVSAPILTSDYQTKTK